jgi:hypothetical protein
LILTKNVTENDGSEANVLGLFPYFGPEAVGGVQASARIAWDAVTKHAQIPPTLLVYANENHSRSSRNGADALVVNSKRKAVYKALSRSWPHNLAW